MLNDTTKRKINSLRDILVGKVPDPKSQVEQITNALIYKYMDDMDQQAIVFGGKASFFVGEYQKYAWKNLMDPKLGGQDRMNLYTESLEKMSRNKNLSPIFRDILKGAFLPYRSPETLNMFLHEIDGFSYDHSEDLGDAFEYLLAIMGSQGDAGQFRTPRHIIDFIVDVIDPQKNETILDPACGTAGFLISAYKHIRENNQDKSGASIMHDEMRTIHKNFTGYDISPEMVKLSRVNMFLHNFPEPKIFEYDSLSSDERWDDNFDVILANPPFMTPKGGIIPHKRFSVPANRAEVLFVDYIMNHLRSKGRAGIIVPEGIIFQSGNVYKQLRKNLVEDGLYGVVSLPSGVFAPYSGVKTSILLFNNELAKSSKEILFVKIENDGFDLGAQRREIAKNDLPKALEILNKWKIVCHSGLDPESMRAEILKQVQDDKMLTLVEKSKIAESGDYNLSGDRYRIATDYSNAKWPMVELGEVAEILNGYSFKSEKYTDKGIRVIRITNVQKGEIVDDNPKFYNADSSKEVQKFLLLKNDLLISLTGNVGRVGLLQSNLLPAGLNQRVGCIRLDESKQISIHYLFHVLNTELFEDDCIRASSGVAQKNLSTEWLKKYQIPLPPLEIQAQIVAELDGYQNIITGAKQITANWKPRIEIDPKWKKVAISDVCKIERGASPRPIDKFITKDAKGFNWVKIGDTKNADKYITQTKEQITKEGAEKSRKVFVGDFILSNSMSFGHPYIMKIEGYIHDGWLRLSEDEKKIGKDFLYYILGSDIVIEQFENVATGGVVRNLNSELVRNVIIPLPPLTIQKQIVSKIEAERELVQSAKKLIEIYEQKTKDAIAKLWEQ
ncbi:MAG: N-6 DNA methylase [Candidatus Moraniibacteriota bacterium]